MPRSRSGKQNAGRGGRRVTTAAKIAGRRDRNAKRTRLIVALRRIGIVTVTVGTVAGFGAWAWTSGFVPRTMDSMEYSVQNAAANAGYAVENVLVEGRVNADPDVLLSLINVRRGDPIMSFDPVGVKAQLERVSWVAHAHVERRLPDTIYVRLTERVPLALWQNAGKVRLVDTKGAVLAETNLAKFRDLLLIVGDGAPNRAASMMALLDAEPDVRTEVEAATWVGNRRWDLKMKNGIVVRLPEKDIAVALSRLATAQADDKILSKDLTIIDLRDGERITVRTRPGGVQEYKASVQRAAGGDNDI